MGLETAAIAMMAVSAASAAGQAASQSAAASAKQTALDLQSKEMQIQAQQKTLSNYSVMEKTIASQKAAMSATGLSMNSPSFNAIQRNTLNIGAKNQSNIDLESSLDENNLNVEKENVQNTLYAQLFGDAGQVAGSGTKFLEFQGSLPNTTNVGKAS